MSTPTSRPESALNVRGATNLVAASVMTTCASKPSSRRANQATPTGSQIRTPVSA